MEVSVEGLVPAVAAEDGHDVLPAESAAASEGEYRRELPRERGKVREMAVLFLIKEAAVMLLSTLILSGRKHLTQRGGRVTLTLLSTDTEGILPELHPLAAAGQTISQKYAAANVSLALTAANSI